MLHRAHPRPAPVRYGADAARAIWALAGTKIVLGGNTDADMAQEISTLAGMYGGEMTLPVVPVAYIRQLPESRALVLATKRAPIAAKRDLAARIDQVAADLAVLTEWVRLMRQWHPLHLEDGGRR